MPEQAIEPVSSAPTTAPRIAEASLAADGGGAEKSTPDSVPLWSCWVMPRQSV